MERCDPSGHIPRETMTNRENARFAPLVLPANKNNLCGVTKKKQHAGWLLIISHNALVGDFVSNAEGRTQLAARRPLASPENRQTPAVLYELGKQHAGWILNISHNAVAAILYTSPAGNKHTSPSGATQQQAREPASASNGISIRKRKHTGWLLVINNNALVGDFEKRANRQSPASCHPQPMVPIRCHQRHARQHAMHKRFGRCMAHGLAGLR